ncbi:MAG: hypothetical protein P4L85_05240 [Paludisphaera borealis]|uniref:hypothetical protein n=1 Tax=Paludisphaera borealis TaxID=1387353 RepID=UPI002849D2FC|nr:hypothetical protein [Paludisphaera borealis]MDR3618736.1 hypothetical protein [Paludisphaera borealis]
MSDSRYEDAGDLFASTDDDQADEYGDDDDLYTDEDDETFSIEVGDDVCHDGLAPLREAVVARTVAAAYAVLDDLSLAPKSRICSAAVEVVEDASSAILHLAYHDPDDPGVFRSREVRVPVGASRSEIRATVLRTARLGGADA